MVLNLSTLKLMIIDKLFKLYILDVSVVLLTRFLPNEKAVVTFVKRCPRHTLR
jgi:hypothetical protein